MSAVLRRLLQSLASRQRALFYRALGMKLDGKVWLEAIEWPARPACVRLCVGAALGLARCRFDGCRKFIDDQLLQLNFGAGVVDIHRL